MGVLLETVNLKRIYGTERNGRRRGRLVRAVDDVSLRIEEGASLALIGESGSGKTTFGKLVIGLERPTEGKILFRGEEIQHLGDSGMRRIRGDMQMIFQSSGGVFDPRYTIGESITEVLKNYKKMSTAGYRDEVCMVLEKVGLDASFANRYVRSLSGGQCQRANIARAIALRPALVICDEPVSSLDYSIRKQILNLLNEMQEAFGLTYLLITHDLSNVPYVCKRVAIMYQGQVVEYLERTGRIEEEAKHPYTRLLFRSIPARHPGERKLLTKEDEREMSASFAAGCCFQNRCPHCSERCRRERPSLCRVEEGQLVACHRFA